jgi:hypothetical protein
LAVERFGKNSASVIKHTQIIAARLQISTANVDIIIKSCAKEKNMPAITAQRSTEFWKKYASEENINSIKAEGEMIGNKKIVRHMKSQKKSVSQIASLTGLSEEDVKSLLKD